MQQWMRSSPARSMLGPEVMTGLVLIPVSTLQPWVGPAVSLLDSVPKVVSL